MVDDGTCVLLFVKYPKKGQVKKRLSTDLPTDIVVELYRNFVQDILSTLEKLRIHFLICFTPQNSKKIFMDWLGTSHCFVPQKGHDLGERMKQGFLHAFTEGFKRVILIGSDIPDLPSVYIENACDSLGVYDVVIGLSSDGGYYLIGFTDTTFLPGVFEQIHWGDSTVFQETVNRCQQAGYRIKLLPVWSDIDTFVDLKNMIRRNHRTAFQSSHTMSYVMRHPELFTA